jgi:hypothetical protein
VAFGGLPRAALSAARGGASTATWRRRRGGEITGVKTMTDGVMAWRNGSKSGSGVKNVRHQRGEWHGGIKMASK